MATVPNTDGREVARTQAVLQASVGVVALGCATAATLTGHMADSTYATLLGAVFGWAFANFRHATNRRAGE